MSITILHLMGPTCAGKSTMITKLLSLSNEVGAVQIGKLMRAKYGEAHFKGQAAPEHTKDEALQMYFDEIQKHITDGKKLILIDGQPRDISQAQAMNTAWPQYTVKYFMITADHEVREQRARKDRAPGANLDLAIARLNNDYKSNYLVMCELIKLNVPITMVDTSASDFDLDEFCSKILLSINSEKVFLNFDTPDALYYACERLHPDLHDRARQVTFNALGATDYVRIEIDLGTGEAIIKK